MILIIYTLKWSETIFERAINLKTFLQLGISMNETFKYFVKMQVHKNDIATLKLISTHDAHIKTIRH